MSCKVESVDFSDILYDFSGVLLQDPGIVQFAWI
jgi:hypothetical protein